MAHILQISDVHSHFNLVRIYSYDFKGVHYPTCVHADPKHTLGKYI
jgi:hypothetical protein